MEEDNKLHRTPKDLLDMLFARDGILAVELVEQYSESGNIIVAIVTTNFWTRLRCVLSSDYKIILRMKLQVAADDFLPSEISIKIVLSV